MKVQYYIVPRGKKEKAVLLSKSVEGITLLPGKNPLPLLAALQNKLEQWYHEKGISFNSTQKHEENAYCFHATDTAVHDHTIEEFCASAGCGALEYLEEQKAVESEKQKAGELGEDDFAPFVSEICMPSQEREPVVLVQKPMETTPISNGAFAGDNGNYKKRRKSAPKIFGKMVTESPIDIININEGRDKVTLEGNICGVEIMSFPTINIVTFNIVDTTNSLKAKAFFKILEDAEAFEKQLKTATTARLAGKVSFDKFDSDLVFEPQAIMPLPNVSKRTEQREDSRVELHLHTKMSDKDALVTVKDLISTIKEWGHPAVAITDHGVVQAFPEAQAIAAEKGVKIIYGMEGYLIENPDSDKRYHIIILAKNLVGIRNLYKLITLSHLNYYKRRPRLPRSVIDDHREGLILGSACEAGELIQAIIRGESPERLRAIASFYDYLEIQPICNNEFLVRKGLVPDEETLRDINRTIVELGEDLHIPVVATCDVHFLNPEDKIYREIMLTASGFTDAHEQPDLYLRTTDEMLAEFQYLGEEKAYEVVVTNSRLINDQIDSLKPIPDGTYAPKIEGADDDLKNMCHAKAEKIYGTPLPAIVKERLDYELKSIIGHGFGVLYYIAHKLVGKSLADGYLVGSRGSVGSSFVATMADITEVNPLPPHYICKHCTYSEFITDGSYAGGFDLPHKTCPQCGHTLSSDGHDIPFAIFMGFDGDKVPDIDLNFSGDYQPRAHKYTEELFGRDNVFRAGTIGTIAAKTAFGYVRKYAELNGMQCRNGYYEELAKGFINVKNTTGQHPGGIMVCPRDMDVHHFTPVQYPANKKESGIITTHFDYHSIEGRMTKLDILGHDDPTIIRMLEDITGVDVQTIPFDDPQTLSLFSSTEAIGLTPADLQGDTVASLGIPEFGTNFVRQMLQDSQPKTFSELVRISGFSHGTNVWLDNAQNLIREGVCKVNEAISTRDDIMNYLMHRDIEPIVCFSIMENVRKGKGIEKRNKQGEATTNYIQTLKDGNIPEWFIDSCLKISYLFPRAHAVAYVMMAFRIAWFKINYPLAFYASYFSIRAKAFDCKIMIAGLAEQQREYKRIKNMGKAAANKELDMLTALEVSMEMNLRGFEFSQVNIWQSDAKRFVIVDGKLLPPLIAIDGLGETVTLKIIDEREQQPFTSIKDVQRRCKISQTILETMQELECFGELPNDEQMDLFSF